MPKAKTLMFSAIYVISIFSSERSVAYQKLKVGHLVQQKGVLGVALLGVALSSFKLAGGLSERLGAHGIDLNFPTINDRRSPLSYICWSFYHNLSMVINQTVHLRLSVMQTTLFI